MSHTMVLTHNGVKLEVEYDTEGDGSGPTYSPIHGADSGDPLIVLVLKVVREDTQEEVKLNDDEVEKIAEYITEHHEFDYYEPDGGP